MSIKDNLIKEVSRIKMSPQKKRIYSLPKEVLLKHYALIMHKASSLSSSERMMVKGRVQYGINRRTIKTEEVVDAVNELTNWVESQIKGIIDDSSTEQ